MSWATNKATIVSLLTTAGYTELPDNAFTGEQSATLSDKGYSFKPVNISTSYLMNNSTVSSDIAELKIGFECLTNSQYDTAMDAFKTVLTTIDNYRLGYLDNPSFERHDTETSYAIGTALFYLGVETC